VLVVGAGASFEAPTGLPLSRECALEAHRRLVLDEVLAEGACPDPEDLSCVADAVVASTGEQDALVERLPIAGFRFAEPNEGYLLAACLLRERAVACVMTLNFDLAMQTALSKVGAGDDVGVVRGPDEHHRLSTVNLIYLHRNVDAAPGSWILRTSALKDAWKEEWEEVVAGRVLAGPVTVFAGLGTPAAVLLETVRRVRKAIPSGTLVYQVDPGEREASEFFVQLSLSEAEYLQMGWCQFAEELGDRLLEEHRHDLEQACRGLIAAEGWSEPSDLAELCTRLAGLGLMGLGELRARWSLDRAVYAPHRSVADSLLADLLLAVGEIEKSTGALAIFDADGIVELRQGNRILGSIAMASGRGTKRWDALEAEIGQERHRHRRRAESPKFALVSGVQGTRPTEVAPPNDIITEDEPTSILRRSLPRLVSVEELRASPEIAQELAA
jgi:hypothetical protein